MHLLDRSLLERVWPALCSFSKPLPLLDLDQLTTHQIECLTGLFAHFSCFLMEKGKDSIRVTLHESVALSEYSDWIADVQSRLDEMILLRRSFRLGPFSRSESSVLVRFQVVQQVTCLNSVLSARIRREFEKALGKILENEAHSRPLLATFESISEHETQLLRILFQVLGDVVEIRYGLRRLEIRGSERLEGAWGKILEASLKKNRASRSKELGFVSIPRSETEITLEQKQDLEVIDALLLKK